MVASLFGACSTDNVDDVIDDLQDTLEDVLTEYDISINTEELTFNAIDSLSKTVTISASAEWMLLNSSDSTIYAYADWVSSVSPASGEAGSCDVTVTVSKNLTSQSRDTKLYFGIKNVDDAESVSYELFELTLNQVAYEGNLSVDRSDVWFSGLYADESYYTQSINVSSEVGWRLLTSDDDSTYMSYDWLTFTVAEGEGDGQLTFTVAPYGDDVVESRSAHIYLQQDVDDAAPLYVKISQFANSTSHLSSQQSSLGTFYVDQAGTPINFSIISSHAWTIADNDPEGLTGALEWVAVSPTTGVCNDWLTLSCEANNTGEIRESNIYTQLEPSGDYLYQSFKVIQAGIDGLGLTFSVDTLSMPVDGSAAEVTVSSSHPWKIAESSQHASWLTPSITSGEDGDVISFTTDVSSDFVYRQTEVAFDMEYYPGMEPLVLKVTQEGNYTPVLSVSRDDIWFSSHYDDASNYTYSIDVTSDYSWYLLDGYASNDWLTFNNASGTGNGTLSFTLAPYDEDTYNYRSAYIYVQQDVKDAAPVLMKISQFSKLYSHLSSQQSTLSIFYVDQAGTPINFTITSSHAWTITENDPEGLTGALSWVGLSPKTGICNDAVVLDCEPNNSISSRESNIYTNLASSGDWQYQSFKVVQAGIEGLSFSLSRSSVLLTYLGTGVSVDVTSSGSWYIDADSPHYADDWLDVTNNSRTSNSSGSSGDNITFSASENSFDYRETQVYFRLEGYPDVDPVVCTIAQAGKSYGDAALSLSCISASEVSGGILISESSYNVQSYNITVASELPWRVVGSTDYSGLTDYSTWVSLTGLSSGNAGTSYMTVSLKKNNFRSERSTTINLQQEYDGELVGDVMSISIRQAANSLALLDDYGYLGYGYNTAGLYADWTGIKAKVLDWDKMESYNMINEVLYVSSVDYVAITDSSVEDAQDSLSVSAGVSAAYSGFTAEVKADYSTATQSYSETEYGSTSVIVKLANITTNTAAASGGVLTEALKYCMTDQAYLDICGYSSMSASEVIATYGTHVMLGCTYGGTWQYSVSALRNKDVSTDSWGTALKAGYDDTVNSLTASAEVGSNSYMSKSSFYSEERIQTQGGSGSITDPDTWRASLDSSNMSIVDYSGSINGNNLIPICDFAVGESRRDQLYQAALAASSTLDEVTPSQSIFSYEFWLGDVTYLGGDGIGSTAEVVFDIDTKMIDATASISDVSWSNMWCTSDTGSDYFDAPTEGNGAAYLTMGTGTATQTNRFTTGSMFLSGSGSNVIAFKVYLAERDSSTNFDDASTTYVYFKTIPGYSGIHTATASPFVFYYSQYEQSDPQGTIAAGANYTQTWLGATAVDLGNGNSRNGYASSVGMCDSEHKWSFTLYYRML
ncbi:MAG: BACON domain-containing carbohydrate-binding protein [Rikenellaceae bacterium]